MQIAYSAIAAWGDAARDGEPAFAGSGGGNGKSMETIPPVP